MVPLNLLICALPVLWRHIPTAIKGGGEGGLVRDVDIVEIQANKQMIEYTYHIHLNCANQCNSAWQHIQNSIESKLNEKMDTLYHKLNRKLDILIKQTYITHTNMKNTNTQSRLINLANTTFSKKISTIWLLYYLHV
jgi:hypothetical protein